MIRIVVTDEQRSVDIRVDADVWEDIATRALRLLLTNEIPVTEQLEGRLMSSETGHFARVSPYKRYVRWMWMLHSDDGHCDEDGGLSLRDLFAFEGGQP